MDERNLLSVAYKNVGTSSAKSGFSDFHEKLILMSCS